MFTRIIIGLIIAVVGAGITMKSDFFYYNFGSIPTFDKYLGAEGGSRLGYKLIGILITVIGFLIMTNMIGAIILSIFGGVAPAANDNF